MLQKDHHPDGKPLPAKASAGKARGPVIEGDEGRRRTHAGASDVNADAAGGVGDSASNESGRTH